MNVRMGECANAGICKCANVKMGIPAIGVYDFLAILDQISSYAWTKNNHLPFHLQYVHDVCLVRPSEV
jgi:hypothetical protein